MSFYSLLNKTVYIMHRTTSTNEWGEKISSYSTSSSASCRLSPITDEIRLTLPGEFKNVVYKSYLLSDTSVTYDDRILYNGDQYRIRSIVDDSISHHKTLLLERLP